ncbi:MAG TPA: branched-chain amino acid ABC transporter permease [Acidimicrobiales bacterium]|nr:branched-chain amino acid ABC transporter permease [Acidimicrobiales bacterium]
MRARVRGRIRTGGRATALALTGAVTLILAAFSPWATFAGFPGKMSLGGFAGGARLFALALGVAAMVIVFDVRGRRQTGLSVGLGSLAVVGVNVVAIAGEGGALGGVAWGAWLALAGAGAIAAGAFLLPTDRPPGEEWRQLPAPIEASAMATGLLAVLGLVVWGLRIEESSRFISFLVFVGFASVSLHHLGLFDWMSSLFTRRVRLAMVLTAAVAIAFPFTQEGNSYWIRVFASIGVFAVAAIGLNVVVGLAGLLDLGYVAFFGVGAYVGALFADATLTTVHVHLPFLLVILLGGTIAAVFGLVIGAPTLRLRGDYLAIVTLGFGEIFRITANNWDGLTGGPNGISGVPDLAIGSVNLGEAHTVFGVSLPGFANYYFVELLLLAAAILVFTRLDDSRIGRAWVAIREDELAAAASGVDTVRLKLMAFAIGAFLAGAAGTVNAHVTSQVSPDSYTFLESILLVAAVVLGGMGTVRGALLGSAALFIIPEKLRAFQDKRLLLFGIALILMMRLRPEGMAPSRRRQRELREEAPEGVAGATGAPPGRPVAP